MTVEELVAELSRFPGYWPVQVQVTVHELSELTGEESDREHRAPATEVDTRQDSWQALAPMPAPHVVIL